MKPKITILRRTCREAAALLIAREDRALSLPDNIALRLHLLACLACPKFENQVLTLRAAMGRWRNYTSQDGEKNEY
ncbi:MULTISPECIES: zf-HC2 domain-containing protein [Polaromonas]|uniref:Zf-HC2 domain-containing protein n=1 Tax=Polaromonas aquatica TaxID=332657 RepID=A0ABW1TWN9_9BURK